VSPVSLVKTQQVALSTIILNYSCLIIQGAGYGAITIAIQLAEKIINSNPMDPEALYRAFVAIGNIVYATKAKRGLLDPPVLSSISTLGNKLAGKEDRFRAVAGELKQLVSDLKMISN